MLGWTVREQTGAFLSEVAALAGSSFSEVDADTITSKLPDTNVLLGHSLEWRPKDSAEVIVHIATAPGEEDVSVRVVTNGDAGLAERVRELLQDAV